MDVTLQKTDDLHAILELKIVKADYEEKVNNELKSQRKAAKMPGFRPGKVPMGLIKKMAGTQILVQEVNKLIAEGVDNYLKENEINFIGDPLPSETKKSSLDFENQEEFELYFDLGLAPEFDTEFIKELSVNYYKIDVTEEEINNAVKDYQKRNSIREEDVESFEEKDLVKGNLNQLNEEGITLEDGITRENEMISLDYIKDEEIKKLFPGKKIGDVITFDVKKAFENNADLKAILGGISDEEIENLSPMFSYEITEIIRFKDPELNEELFKKVFPEDEITTEEAFRAKIKENIENSNDNQSFYKFSIDSKEAILESLKDKELPVEFIKRWLKVTQKEKDEDKRLTDEQIEEQIPSFIDGMKWSLVVKKISKDKELLVTDEELQSQAYYTLVQQMYQYGMGQYMSDPEFIKSAVERTLEDENQRNSLAMQIIDRKVFQYLKETASLIEQDITADDFHAFFEKEEEKAENEESTTDETNQKEDKVVETDDTETATSSEDEENQKSAE